MTTKYFEMMRDTVGAYGEGVDIARRRRAEDERAARERAEFEQRQREWNRTNARAREEDAAFSDMASLQRGVVTQATGLSQPSGQMLYHNGYGNATGAEAVRNAAGDFDREQARMGLQRTMEPTAPVQSHPATEIEMNRALQRVAIAQRDRAGVRQAGIDIRALEDDEVFAAGAKKGFDPEMAKWVNGNHKSVTVGAPDARGFVPLSVVTPTGEAVFNRLSRAEQAQLSGAIALMERNPTKALQIIAGVNKDLAAVVAADNNLTLNIADKTNSTALRRGQLANDDRRTSIAAGHLGLARDEAKRRAEREQVAGGRVRQYKNKDGDIVEVFEVMTPKGLERREIPLPAGLRPVTQRDPTLQTELTKAYAADLSAAGDDPKKIDKVKNKYRAAGLEGLGEDPILAALAKAAGRPGADAQPAAGLRPPQTPSVPRRFDGQRFGMLTPRAVVEEAAAAGNPDAIRYLQAMEENAAMPRDTASMMAP